MKKHFLTATLIISAVIFSAWAVNKALEKTAEAECLQWKEWVEQGHNKFQASPLVLRQCKQFGIDF